MNNVLAHAAATPLDNSIRYIPLTQGKCAVVDAADFDFLSQWKWYAHFDKRCGKWYAERSERYGPRREGKKRLIQMHRILLNAPHGMDVDHKDGDGLNNRRSSNIRLATRHQNHGNRGPARGSVSGYKGVHYHSQNGNWRARISVNGKSKHLGSFDSAEDAARAYDKAAVEYFGEFASLNFSQ